MHATFSLPADFLASTPKMSLPLPEGFTGLVLHCCCAPCSTALLECLLFHHLRPVLFFYNPNIQPQDEYAKRRDEWLELAEKLELEAVVGDYAQAEWLSEVRGLEQEPERGARCAVCFKHRLTATALLTRQRGLSHFTTTLATSRWKSKRQVDEAGLAAARLVPEVHYWAEDWRKNGLVTRRYELVRSIGFYNQQYCGCVFSRNSKTYSA